ncbi:hypothetical protein [Candidatus Magnetominusculus xianensis]|uniref:DUF1634 domain-containing protein n=1 Tax=Candidatus Magnetominusculus xianensis TaxID=1748249 RepID=A0ABR5SI99_9BACT|nr:hypothetical protein [Candidatus Magnetominusculus xianensis]KWT92152.1 hypothetical protein ASN18_0555 [Candidatus Magnetominusculus xianensis]MBF0404677.1 hypothetical protein [Nitrospirota bacterium]
MEKKVVATEEQLRYAALLNNGMKIGMAMLLISFAIYAIGILPPFVPVEDLPKLWGMSVHDYLNKTGIHEGWSWLKLLNKGDFLNFLGIAFLGGVTIVCFLAIIPILIRKKDHVYALIAALEVTVLILAASGLLKTGGH